MSAYFANKHAHAQFNCVTPRLYLEQCGERKTGTAPWLGLIQLSGVGT